VYSDLPDILGLPGVISTQRVTDWSHHTHLQLGEVGQIIVERHPTSSVTDEFST